MKPCYAKHCNDHQTQIIKGAHQHLNFDRTNFIFDRDDWKVGAEHKHLCGVYHLEPECTPAEGTELYFFNLNKAVNIISSAHDHRYGNFWHITFHEANEFVVLRWVGKGYLGWEIVAASPDLHVHSLNLPGNLIHTFATVRRIPISAATTVPPSNPAGIRDFMTTVNINPLSPSYGKILNYSWASDSGLADPSVEYHHGSIIQTGNQAFIAAGSLLWNTASTPQGGTGVDFHQLFPETHPNRTGTASAVNIARVKADTIHTIRQNPYTGDLLSTYLGTPGTGTPSYGPAGFISIANKPLFPSTEAGIPISTYHVIGENPAELCPSTLEDVLDDWNYDYDTNHCTGTLMSSSWGPPSSFDEGFDLSKPYGRAIRIYQMATGAAPLVATGAAPLVATGAAPLVATGADNEEVKPLTFVKLFVCDPVPQMGGPEGGEGVVPLEVRRLHHPEVEKYFVGITLPGAVDFLWKDGEGGWQKKVAITPAQLAKDCSKVNLRDGSAIPGGCPKFAAFNNMPTPLVTDITLSEGDEFLYVSCWLGGAVLQYDIRDPSKPKFVDGVGNLGGVKTIDPYVNQFNTASRVIKGAQFNGGSQMLRLTPNGQRLFITSSLFSGWDDEFFPSGPGSIKDHGGNLICIHTGVKRGSKVAACSVDETFGVAYKDLKAVMANGEEGVFRARPHECHIKGISH